MQKAGLLPSVCSQAWRSLRMASSGMSRPHPLANKVALVTASTDGIGLAIARRLAQDGAHVVVSSRKQQNVDRAVATLQEEGLSVTGTVCHVGKAEDRERLVATILDINVKATAMLTKAVVPEMKKRGGGSVVIVASLAAYTPFPGLGPYNVSKTALVGLTKNLAIELAATNIRVNCLAPGLIKTNFSRVLWMEKANEESIKELLRIKRIGKPEECAGIVSFLCSEDASYISGETMVVAGGASSRL
ncbi:PREDICTED: dehydrogenase/reductase SDR family member 4-like isoform X2 [Elephantulus edwardii]|uniref:dehydrogenase/reductase SDR family member 4-like isoform X2 n=1 Tax=Elephantulus edwardii TaxID=28737 RepID=UPI0003F07B14|nr:PREDICTED: dehydrogenase/reductase SDR family member 4-like isoform X2 [Elephantulus edwardii]